MFYLFINFFLLSSFICKRVEREMSSQLPLSSGLCILFEGINKSYVCCNNLLWLCAYIEDYYTVNYTTIIKTNWVVSLHDKLMTLLPYLFIPFKSNFFFSWFGIFPRRLNRIWPEGATHLVKKRLIKKKKKRFHKSIISICPQ